MNTRNADILVIGGGAAGMAAALECAQAGKSVILTEREAQPGGILNQCIHNGFGLHYFEEELTGPEFSGRLICKMQNEERIEVFTSMTVMEFRNEEGAITAYGYSGQWGVTEFRVRAVILAMGSRERNRGSIPIPGTRPAGVFTAGLAQRLINIEGQMPGKRVVIVGSGDIGLIMARRLTWSGIKVLAVVEIQPYPAGLTRNIVQCLNDYSIPLYLSHVVSRIYGKNRVAGVEINPVEEGNGQPGFFLSCDTVLLSVGLVPENEITKKAGIVLHPVTGGAVVSGRFMTGMPGVFACGNVLHIHDLVDYCATEAEECARGAVAWLDNGPEKGSVRIKSGANVRYTVPHSIIPGEAVTLGLRSLIVENSCHLGIFCGPEEIYRKKLLHVQPSEMIRIQLKPGVTEGLLPDEELEVRLQ